MLKNIVKKIFNLAGLDISYANKNPGLTLLGLKKLPVKSVIDVGANSGQFAKHLHRVFPEARIYCFEPLREPFDKLNAWAVSTKGRVNAFNVALGDIESSLDMFCHAEHVYSSSFLKTTRTCETLYPFTKKQFSLSVQQKRLDKFSAEFPEMLIPEILIKLDVQGYEDRVIKGGVNTFHKARACLLEVNLDNLYENQANFRDILIMLYDLGFHYAGNLEQVFSDRDGHVIYIDAMFQK
jgi:FkbM family methyltransferase